MSPMAQQGGGQPPSDASGFIMALPLSGGPDGREGERRKSDSIPLLAATATSGGKHRLMIDNCAGASICIPEGIRPQSATRL